MLGIYVRYAFNGTAPILVDSFTCPYFYYLFLVDFRRVVVEGLLIHNRQVSKAGS